MKLKSNTIGKIKLTNEQITLLSTKVLLNKIDMALLERFVYSILEQEFNIHDEFIVEYVWQIITVAGGKDSALTPLNPIELANGLSGFTFDTIGVNFIVKLWKYLIFPPKKTTNILPQSINNKVIKNNSNQNHKKRRFNDSYDNNKINSMNNNHGKKMKKRSRWRSRSPSPSSTKVNINDKKSIQKRLNQVVQKSIKVDNIVVTIIIIIIIIITTTTIVLITVM